MGIAFLFLLEKLREQEGQRGSADIREDATRSIPEVCTPKIMSILSKPVESHYLGYILTFRDINGGHGGFINDGESRPLGWTL